MRITNIISTRNFANPSHAKKGAGTIKQEAIPNVGNLSSKWAAPKWALILIKWICGLIHKFSCGGIHSNVACSADFGYGIFSSILILRPFTVHYQNVQSRRNLLLCENSERDYKQQHWIKMLALPRQNTIMPLSGLLHRVRRCHDFCLNNGCFAIEKRVQQKISSCILLPVITKKMCDHIFNCW